MVGGATIAVVVVVTIEVDYDNCENCKNHDQIAAPFPPLPPILAQAVSTYLLMFSCVSICILNPRLLTVH